MTEKVTMSDVINERGVTASPSAIADYLQHIMKCNLRAVRDGRKEDKVVACLWGAAGIAKTSLIKQLSKVGVELDGKRVYPHVTHVALAQIEETGDLTGLPVTSVDYQGNPITTYARPVWWPTDELTKDGNPVILLIDDFNRAQPSILKGIMQILQDYKSNIHDLPDNCHIMLTGNPPSGDDGTEYMVNEIDKAILTRMLHFTMKFDKVDWARWAKGSNIDDRVTSFVLAYPELCNGENSQRTNPRSIAQFAHLIKDIPDLKASGDLLHALARSCMDESASVMFEKFALGDMQKLVDPEEILKDWKSAEKKLDGLKKRGAGKDGETKLRADLMGITVDRMYIYLMQEGLDLTKSNFEAFLSFISRTDLISEDLMYTLLRRLRMNAKSDKQKKLFMDLIQHGGDKITELIMKIS